MPEDIQYYDMNGKPYDPASGRPWFYKEPGSGKWWGGLFALNGGFNCSELNNEEWYLSSEQFSWMGKPGPGLPNLFNNPIFIETKKSLATKAGWIQGTPVEPSHVGQYPVETPFGVVWKDDASKKAGDLTVNELKALMRELLSQAGV
ncbi:hypothetical protein EHM92_00095 [bacterium]|nr:MAG: hypothetical protein EHM92_00095 [bacterium]